MKQSKHPWLPPILLFAAFLLLSLVSPQGAARSLQTTLDYGKEMLLIMPPVFILMGLMDVWIPKKNIQKLLGSGSGFKGGIVAFILGTLPTGPLYVAFPMAAGLLGKGASIANMILFLGSWAALKIPQLLVEVKFLGIAFTLLRFFLTLAMLICIGMIMEFALRRESKEQWSSNTEPTAAMKRMG